LHSAFTWFSIGRQLRYFGTGRLFEVLSPPFSSFQVFSLILPSPRLFFLRTAWSLGTTRGASLSFLPPPPCLFFFAICASGCFFSSELPPPHSSSLFLNFRQVLKSKHCYPSRSLSSPVELFPYHVTTPSDFFPWHVPTFSFHAPHNWISFVPYSSTGQCFFSQDVFLHTQFEFPNSLSFRLLEVTLRSECPHFRFVSRGIPPLGFIGALLPILGIPPHFAPTVYLWLFQAAFTFFPSNFFTRFIRSSPAVPRLWGTLPFLSIHG